MVGLSISLRPHLDVSPGGLHGCVPRTIFDTLIFHAEGLLMEAAGPVPVVSDWICKHQVFNRSFSLPFRSLLKKVHVSLRYLLW